MGHKLYSLFNKYDKTSINLLVERDKVSIRVSRLEFNFAKVLEFSCQHFMVAIFKSVIDHMECSVLNLYGELLASKAFTALPLNYSQ